VEVNRDSIVVIAGDTRTSRDLDENPPRLELFDITTAIDGLGFAVSI
jgi:hypothetical protein